MSEYRIRTIACHARSPHRLLGKDFRAVNIARADLLAMVFCSRASEVLLAQQAHGDAPQEGEGLSGAIHTNPALILTDRHIATLHF
ncbi:hypothetical protein [Paraburkholderia susongensis]|uniref:hypothetical protein n=1 Tax=Paraburkholderia susongensis TaxID=1515439 RepID=UPI0011800143|nr:hypothetical protein [Paraburkholderia susongensis]